MKNMKKLTVIGLLLGVGALQAPAAPATPTTWVQTLNFSLTAPDAGVPAGKYTIASKNILELLAGDIITNTVTVVTNFVQVLQGTNPATAAPILAVTNSDQSPLLFALSTNTPAFPTNSVTVTNVAFSVLVSTNLFTNTISVAFTELTTNVYSFPNTVTLTGTNPGTMTEYLITSNFTYSFTYTNYGTNVTVSLAQPATSLIATNQVTNWVLVAASLPEAFTNNSPMSQTNVSFTTIAQTNTFNPKNAKLALVTPLALPGTNFWWVLDSKGNKVADVSPFFDLTDIATNFDVTITKGANTTVDSLQALTITGHQGTQIVLEGLFAEALGPKVKGQSYPTIIKSLTAVVAGTAQINAGIDPANLSFSAKGVLSGKITTTGAAK
jgi:hypothetical protein